MTSTNDGKDVKNVESSGLKGKLFYIDLYKSLDTRLTQDLELRERTDSLKAAWQQIHTLCLHSAPNTHPHLLSWLQRHTAKTVLQTEWQAPDSKQIHAILEDGINCFIRECELAVTSRHGRCLPWESQLLQRATWFASMLGNPWGHRVLRMLLDPRGTKPSDDEVLEWLKEERGVMFVTRLRQLTASKCDDLALGLASSVMERVRACTTLIPDNEQSTAKEDLPKDEPTFAVILTKEAGFTVDVWELLTDIEFVLLHKSDKRAQCIDLAKQTPLRDGYQLVERLQSRLETSPKEKKLWKNAKEVATLIAQVIIARCMVTDSCIGVARTALYCCFRSLAKLIPPNKLPAAAAALAAPAQTARHVHTMARAQLQADGSRISFICELYVRAITAGMNELERLKLKTEKAAEARAHEQTLAAWFCQLGNLLCASNRIKCECLLTAFSVHPAPDMYERIQILPQVQSYKEQTQKDNHETTSEFGSWANDSRSQTNLVKTSETLNMKQTQSQNNVLSVAMLNEGETAGLGPELCQDLAVLLSGPRLKTLSWDMDREELLKNCRAYMERTSGGTRALTTELKYLNLDPNSYQHLPEEDDNVDDVYYGIEKGYEHLVEFQEPEPEEIWQDALFSETESDHKSDSSDDSVSKTKKKAKKKPKRNVIYSSEMETDPLSLTEVKEAKKIEPQKEKKKERPHSKERSSDKKKSKSKIKPQFDKLNDQTPNEELKESKQHKGNKERSQSKDKRKDSSQSKERKKEKKKEKKDRKKEEIQTVIDNNDSFKMSSTSVFTKEQKPQLSAPNKIHDKHQLQRHHSPSSQSLNRPRSTTPSSTDHPPPSFDPSGFNQAFLAHLQKSTAATYHNKKSVRKQSSPARKVKSMQTQVKNIVGQLHQNSQTKLATFRNCSAPSSSLHNLPREENIQKTREITPKSVINEEVKQSISRLIQFRKAKPESPSTATAIPAKSLINNSTPPCSQKLSSKPSDKSNREERIQSLREQMNFLLNLNKTNANLLSNKNPKGVPIAAPQSSPNMNKTTTLLDQCANMKSLLVQRSKNVNEPEKPCTKQPSQDYFDEFIKNLQKNSVTFSSASTDSPRQTPTSSSTYVTSQIVKQGPQPKMVHNVPSTFSRLNYMHKNKQDQAKTETLSKTTIPSHSTKLEQLITRPKGVKICNYKSDALNNTTGVSPESLKKISIMHPLRKCDEHISKNETPHIVNNCQSSSNKDKPLKHYPIEGQKKGPITVTAGNTLTLQDQAELLLLLHQQSKLNSVKKTVTQKTTPSIITAAQIKMNKMSPSNLSHITSNTQVQGEPKPTTAPVPSTHPNNIKSTNNNIQAQNVTVGSKIKNRSNLPAQPIQIVTDNSIIRSILNSPSKFEKKPVEHKALEAIPLKEQQSSSGRKTQSKKSSQSRSTYKSKQNEKQDWESVMDLLLAQKTPARRTSNSLDMDLDKSETKKEVKINKTEPNVSKLKRVSTTADSTQHTVRNNDPKKVKLDSAPIPKSSSNKIEPTFCNQRSNEEDPFISGIPNSDYDLLEELMDDELRKEIGELSDEDPFASQASAIKNVAITKDIHTAVSKQSNISAGQSKPIPIPVVCNKESNVAETIPTVNKEHVQTPVSHFIKTDQVIQNCSTVNIASNIPATNPVVANIPGPVNAANYIIAPQHPQVQNMYLIGADVVYDPFTSVQIPNSDVASNTVLAVNNTPLGLYSTAQVVAPLVSPVLLQHTVTLQNTSTIETQNFPSIISQDIITTPNQIFLSEDQTPTDKKMDNIKNIKKPNKPKKVETKRSHKKLKPEFSKHTIKVKNKYLGQHFGQPNRSNIVIKKSRNNHDVGKINPSDPKLQKEKSNVEEQSKSTVKQSLSRNCKISNVTNETNKNIQRKTVKIHDKLIEPETQHQNQHDLICDKSKRISCQNKPLSPIVKPLNESIIDDNCKQHKLDKLVSTNLKSTMLVPEEKNPKELKSNLDGILLKQTERKVLSEVQEKLTSTVGKLENKAITNFSTDLKNQERIMQKRLAIMNRKISHHSYYPSIPLKYTPLRINTEPAWSTSPTITNSLNIEHSNQDQVTTIIGMDPEPIENRECIDYILTPDSQDDVENESLDTANVDSDTSNKPQCRKISLRSSNKNVEFESIKKMVSNTKEKLIEAKKQLTTLKRTSKRLQRKVKNVSETVISDSKITEISNNKNIDKNNDLLISKQLGNFVATDTLNLESLSTQPNIDTSQQIHKLTNNKCGSIGENIINAKPDIDTCQQIHKRPNDKSRSKGENIINAAPDINTGQQIVQQIHELPNDKCRSKGENIINAEPDIDTCQQIHELPNDRCRSKGENIINAEPDIDTCQQIIQQIHKLPNDKCRSKGENIINVEPDIDTCQQIVQQIHKLPNDNGDDGENVIKVDSKLAQNHLESNLTTRELNGLEKDSVSEENLTQHNSIHEENISDDHNGLPSEKILTSKAKEMPRKDNVIQNNPDVQAAKEIIKTMRTPIKIVEIPSKSLDPNVRVARVYLPNNKALKVTITGGKSITYETIFENPQIRAYMMNSIDHDMRKYTMLVKQFKYLNAQSQALQTSQKKDIETIDLLSDDDESNPEVINDFETEFGTYKVRDIDEKEYEKHQFRLKQKCTVKLTKCQINEQLQFVPISDTIIEKSDAVIRSDRERSSISNFTADTHCAFPNNNIIEIEDSDDDMRQESIFPVNQSYSLSVVDTLKDKLLQELGVNKLECGNEIAQLEDCTVLKKINENKSDVIELDSNSPAFDITSSSINDESVNDLNTTLKDKLLQELGVNKLECGNEIAQLKDSTALKKINENKSDVIELDSNSPAFDITSSSINDESVNNLNTQPQRYTEMVNNCFVKLIRCDDPPNIVKYDVKSSEFGLEDDDVQTSSAVSSRRGSFSILSEGPILESYGFSEIIPLHNNYSVLNSGRSSPVMEIYDMLLNCMKCKDSSNMVMPLVCESDYVYTKTHLHLLNKRQSKYTFDIAKECSREVSPKLNLIEMKVPSLMSLVAQFFYNLKHKDHPINRYFKLKRKLIATPSYAFTMKRPRKCHKPDSTCKAKSQVQLENLLSPNNSTNSNSSEYSICVATTSLSTIETVIESIGEKEQKVLDQFFSNVNTGETLNEINFSPLPAANKSETMCETPQVNNTMDENLSNTAYQKVPASVHVNSPENNSEHKEQPYQKMEFNTVIEITPIDTSLINVCPSKLETTSQLIEDSLATYECEKVLSEVEKDCSEIHNAHDERIDKVTDSGTDITNSETACVFTKASNYWEGMVQSVNDSFTVFKSTDQSQETCDKQENESKHEEQEDKSNANTSTHCSDTTHSSLFENKKNQPCDRDANIAIKENSTRDTDGLLLKNIDNISRPLDVKQDQTQKCPKSVINKNIFENDNTEKCRIGGGKNDLSYAVLEKIVTKNASFDTLLSDENINKSETICAMQNNELHDDTKTNKLTFNMELHKEPEPDLSNVLVNNILTNVEENNIYLTKDNYSENTTKQITTNHHIELEVTVEDNIDIDNNDSLGLELIDSDIKICGNKVKTLKELAQSEVRNCINTKQTISISEKSPIRHDKDHTTENFTQNNCLQSTTSSNSNSPSKDMQKTAVVYKNSAVILNGVLHEDPEIGTCYLFPCVENANNPIDAQVLNVTRDGLFEVIQEIDVDDNIVKNEDIVEDEMLDVEHPVLIPKITYFNKCLTDLRPVFEQKRKRAKKRKLEMSEVKICEKKYRKGKNIDYPKLTSDAISQSAYEKEFKRLLDYFATVSYKISYQKDFVETENLHFNWPIKGSCKVYNDNNIESKHFIFEDNSELKVIDPLDRTLTDEINLIYQDEEHSTYEQTEINFNMGFGEGSDRVIHNSENGGSLLKFSAATLSDVKHSQPFLLFEDNEDGDTIKITSSKQEHLHKIKQCIKYVQLRDKVRRFFEKSTYELNNIEEDFVKKDKKREYFDDNYNIISELCKPDFIKPLPAVTIVNVVQLGQLPVSTAAQNPVTCDPRVTQVSDASPPQCSMDNSPRDDSNSEIKTEYTELTTADLSIPLMHSYSQHNQELPLEDTLIPSEHIEIKTEIKVEISSENSNDNTDLLDLSCNTIQHDEMRTFDSNFSHNICNNNLEYSYEINNSVENETDDHTLYKNVESDEDTVTEHKDDNGGSEQTDQLAYAMNAAGITPTPESDANEAHGLANILSQKICQNTNDQSTPNNFTKTSSINAMSLQQAIAQILPPTLNQASDNNQANQNTSVGPQVLHIVQSKNGSGNQITLLENSQQSVISNPNSTQVLHIVQNKTTAPVVSNSGTSNVQQTNSFSGLSLVEGGLQHGSNQLLHIVNTGNQMNGNSGQVLKRVNLLTNVTNVQVPNEQKMLQFVCKSADGNAIQLNAPHQRSMVLRLQPIETPSVQSVPSNQAETEDNSSSVHEGNTTPNNDSNSQQEIKSRSVYEDNYTKFIQNSSDKPSSEKSTSLPKFNQAFGKPVFQEENEKSNELNTDTNSLPNMSDTTNETNETSLAENTMNIDPINQINSPPDQTSPQPPTPPNLVQQIKQTISPMNIQTMHGGVIYTRQIPVNIGGGQTINLITVPSTDDPNQKNQADGVKFIGHGEGEPSIIKIIPQAATNAESQPDDSNNQARSGENAQKPQPQPVLTQMRIKLPMLSKAPHMVSGTRVVRPSFFQIQRNLIGGTNQPVYQQLVLTTASPLGQQTIRLPTQTQTQTRMVKLPSDQSSSESQMSSSTLEQLREFDMVLEQVKERSTVQPNGSSNNIFSGKLHTSRIDSKDSSSVASKTPDTQPVLYSIGVKQTANVAFVTRKATITTPDSSGIADSPTASRTQVSHSNTVHSDTTEGTPVHKSSKKSKSKSKSSSSTPNAMKMHVPPKPSTQKPLEDEQTTQRILYILAEYKEQVENSPDKDKPAPRRRTHAALNTPGSSKRKKSSSSRRSGQDMSPVHGDDSCRTMGSEDSSCGTSQGDCTENCIEIHSPQDSPRKVARKLTFDQDNATVSSPTTPSPRPQPQPSPQSQPQRNVIVADGQTITVARGTAGKPATAVLMPANYILPVSMMKGQQIAIVTNRGPKLLTVGGGGEPGTANALLLQRLIGPAGLKPVLARPGVRHVRLPTSALHNLQAFNLATATTGQPPDSTASSGTASQDNVDSRVPNSPWTGTQDSKLDRSSSPEGSEPWNLPSSADNQEFSYEDVRAQQLNRTVLDAIPDRYSPDNEAQRIFDKMFDTDSKKSYIVDSHVDSPRCGYDIDASDDKAYQVVHKKDGTQQHRRLTHVSAAALRHKYAILEHELRLQKSLSEECEDLGVDSPSASDLFPEADLLFAASPADTAHRAHSPPAQPPQVTTIPQPDIDDQIATDQLLRPDDQDDNSELDVNLALEVEAEIQKPLDVEEFARSHPNTTFHSEPTDDGVVQPFTITEVKGSHITSAIFHANRAPATVLMAAPQTTVISQATAEAASLQTPVKFTDIDNMIDSLPGPHTNSINLSSVLVKDDGLTRFDSILTDSRELHLTNTASAIVHSTGNATQVIRRVCYNDKRTRENFLMDEPDALMGEDAKMVAEDSSRDATLESMADVDDDRSSPERHTELFWESNSASERSESRRPLDFSSDSEKCCKSPSLDETNSTDSSGVGTHMRLDSVIKEARGFERSRSADGSSLDDPHPPLRTYPAAKRLFHTEIGCMKHSIERSLSGKTREGERCTDSLDMRRRAGRGVVKRGCNCCNGSPAPSRPKKPRPRKPNMEFN